MRKDIKFIWYYSNGGSYIEIDGISIRVTMTKKDMKYYAKELNAEFIDKS